MASDRWSLFTTIAPALIGVIALFIPYVLTNILPDLSTKPNVIIEKVGWFLAKGSTLSIKNTGGMPATNMTVVIESKEKIVYATYKMGLPKVMFQNNTSLKKEIQTSINQKSIELKIPRLMQGEGDRLEIDLGFENFQYPNDWRVLAVYDQGSLEGKRSSELSPLLPLVAIIEAGVGGFYLMTFYMRNKKIPLKRIMNYCLNIHKELHDEPTTTDLFEYEWTDPPGTYDTLTRKILRLKSVHDTNDLLKYGYINDAIDFLKIDELIRKLQERRSKLQSGHLSSSQIQRLNKNCLKSIDDLLKDINWSKYQ